ncbi:MAG TPA: prepilin peptidase [Gammaproteobacteria bacterium]|nr:prepilin peptidase [Gammaproteobacteria bacterium]|tara:strand:+ start:1591 stop:2412 length:822 start_codon:yes stop_codon:yes gene_type:complete
MNLDSLTIQHSVAVVFFIAFAAAVGSFINVVVYRLPRMLMAADDPKAYADQLPLSLALPKSHCPACQQSLAAWHLIPVVSWLLLRGRCHFCHAAVSARYPIVELSCILLGLFLLKQFGFTWPTIAWCGFSWALVALVCIDWEHGILPDEITYPLLWSGLLVNASLELVPLNDAVIGAVSGYGMLWILFWSFKLITGKEGLGYGDFKLLAALGGWLGWQTLPSLLTLAAALGLLTALGLRLFDKIRLDQAIPFGPFLAVAAWVLLWLRDSFVFF